MKVLVLRCSAVIGVLVLGACAQSPPPAPPGPPVVNATPPPLPPDPALGPHAGQGQTQQPSRRR